MRLVLGGRKRSKSLQVPNRILRVYMEALRVLSPLWTEGLSNTVLSQGCLPEVVHSAEHAS